MPITTKNTKRVREDWTVFEYAEGNPYIAKNEKEVQRILKKYGNKVKKVKDGYYFIDNSAKTDLFAVDESARKRKPMRENHKNPLDEIPSSRMRVIELDNGDYYYLNYENGMLQAGNVTNNGFYPEYEIEYDLDRSLDYNLERLYDKIEDNFHFESVSKGRKKARRVESMRVGTRPRVRKPIREGFDVTLFRDNREWEHFFLYCVEKYDDKYAEVGNDWDDSDARELADDVTYSLYGRTVVKLLVATANNIDEFKEIASGYGLYFVDDLVEIAESKDYSVESIDRFKFVLHKGLYYMFHDMFANEESEDYDYDELFGKIRKPIRKESMGSHLAEYQKWVDYDMERYGRISDRTMDTIRKAGLSVVKDQYGEYEVIAYDRKESLNRKRIREGMDDRAKQLNDRAVQMRKAQKSARAFYEEFDKDELALLWACCMWSEENPWGKSYDDEVFEAIHFYDDGTVKSIRKKAEEYFYKYFTPLTVTSTDESFRKPTKKSMRESMNRINRHPANRRKK